MQIRAITLNSPDYAKATALREAVLRKPLGVRLSEEDLADDALREHLVAMEKGQVIGSVSLQLEEKALRLKQMAVDPAWQRKGIGAALVTAAEQRGRKLNASTTRLCARCTAKGFYEKQGYAAVSEEFIELGIPHVMMEKKLG